MPTYIPLIHAETDRLRNDTEQLLAQDGAAMADRLQVLEDISVSEHDTYPTFGTELEFSFIRNPGSADAELGVPHKDSLYLEIIRELVGAARLAPYDKGAVIRSTPATGRGTSTSQLDVILNPMKDGSYNTDQPDTDIIEIRTNPAGANEAIERYWRVIAAIGIVAARNDLVAFIINTHVSAATVYDRADVQFRNFDTDEGALQTAAVQHHQSKMRGLQIDAGLFDQTVTLQAWPTKEGTTAIHPYRWEFRHSNMGIADPRVDMLSVYGGLSQFYAGSLSDSIRRSLHPCDQLKFDIAAGADKAPNTDQMALLSSLSQYAVYDHRGRRFTLPAVFDGGGSAYPKVKQNIDTATAFLSGRETTDGYANRASVLRAYAADIALRQSKLMLQRPQNYAGAVIDFTRQLQFEPIRKTHYVKHTNSVESPKGYYAQRSQANDSEEIRAVLGNAHRYLTPADRATVLRAALVEKHMMVIG